MLKHFGLELVLPVLMLLRGRVERVIIPVPSSVQ